MKAFFHRRCDGELCLCASYLLIGLPLILGLPFLIFRFGVTDDYSVLRTAVVQPGLIMEKVMGVGRLIYGPLLEVSARLVADIGQLVWLRLLSLVGLGLMAGLLFKRVVAMGWTPTTALVAMVLLLASPSGSIVGGWASCWPYPYAAILAISAFFMTHRVLSGWIPFPTFLKDGELSLPKRLLVLGTALLALLLCAFIYQPYLFFYLAPLFAALLVRPLEGRRLLAWVAVHLVWLCGAALISFLIFKGLVPILPLEPGGRTALTNDPAGKLRWALTSLLPNALNLFTLRGHLGDGTMAYLLFGTAAVVLPCGRLAREWRTRGGGASCLLALSLALLALASISLFLLIQESYASYRMFFPLVALVALAFTWGLEGVMRIWLSLTVTRWGLILVAALASGKAVERNWTLIALSQSRELVIFERALAEVDWTVGPHLYVVQPGLNDALAPRVSTNEFGFPSTYTDWATEGIVWLYHRRMEGVADDYTLEYGFSVPGDPSRYSRVIDLPQLFSLGYE